MMSLPPEHILFQANNALRTSTYLTNNPSYPFYNKRYRTPLADRSSSFNVLEDDEDVLTLTASDMGNSGGTKRRCMLCPQHCLCRGDCTECTDCGRRYRAGCYDRKSYIVSVSAVNDPPEIKGPDEIRAVEGMPFSLISTDYYEMLGSTMWYRKGPSTVKVNRVPDEKRIMSEMICAHDSCEKVWQSAEVNMDQNSDDFGKTIWTRSASGITITDPDSKDYGFDNRKIKVRLNCSHGRLFINERKLEEFKFNGDLTCDLATDPEVSTLGCRIRLVDENHPQGNVGLYTRKQAAFSEMASCPALVEYTVQEFLNPDGSKTSREKRTILSQRQVPSVIVSTTQKSWGCPCYSNVLFDKTGRAVDIAQPTKNRYTHCSEALFFNNEMPLSSGENVPLVGNRFIALEGSLRDITQVLSNITYLPDPYFNTRIPGNHDEIMIEVDDQGAIGDSLKDANGQIIPTPFKIGRKIIKVSIESVNDPPKIGRRIKPKCESKFAGRKMDCPLGVNDPGTTNLRRMQTWTQVKNWPNTNLETETLVTTMNRSVDFIDLDEDAIFAITPDVLWAFDPDSAESLEIFGASCTTDPPMSSALMCEYDPACEVKCEDPFGRYLSNSYRCVGDAGSNLMERCSIKAAVSTCGNGKCELQAGTIFKTLSNPGEILVEMSVSHGMLTFYPRPPQFPRSLLPEYTVLTNMTAGCSPSNPACKGTFQSCVEAFGITEFDCLFNASHIWLRTTMEKFQSAIANKYITYASHLNYFGPDSLEIWISDQGYTSDLYDTEQTVKHSIPIFVVPINNPPVVRPPGSVLAYQKGVNCRTSYMDYAGTQGTDCRFPDTSKVPPQGRDPIAFEDIDMNSISEACPATCGNLSLILTFDRPNSGGLRFFPLMPTLTYLEYLSHTQKRTMVSVCSDMCWGSCVFVLSAVPPDYQKEDE